MPIPAPAANASWNLEFPGPTLRCEEVNATERHQLRHNIASYLNQSAQSEPTKLAWGYLAWGSAEGFWNGKSYNTGLPFLSASSNGSLVFQHGSESSLVPDFYLVAMPPMFGNQDKVNNEIYPISPSHPPEVLNGAMLHCRLFNSTYRVSFSYLEGAQNITIDAPSVSTDAAMPGINTVIGSWPDAPGVPPCPYLTLPSKPLGRCQFDPETLRALSYQAIMDAFTTNLGGRIIVQEGELDVSTNILHTALLDTHELSFLQTNPSQQTVSNELTAILSAYNTTEVRGLKNDYHATSKLPLKEAIESLFQKATVSLMSSPALQ